MESVVTSDSASSFDLECRSIENDAWYSVRLVLDSAAETLTVNYSCSPEVHKVVHSAGDFMTEARLEELLDRFRPVSRWLQDDECLRVSVDTSVCAAYGTDDNDLLFHDATVEDVKHRPHSYVGGEDECLCTFMLRWQHGRGRGTLTHANIAKICLLEPATEIDPRLCAFAKLVNKKIASSKSISVGSDSSGTPNDKGNICSSIKKVVGSSQNRLLKSETSMKIKSLTSKVEEDSAEMRCCGLWTGDDDMGPKSCNADGSVTTDGHFFILIGNLEKDLTPSSIKNFIFEKASILPEAWVFPRKLSDQFARGTIMVDSQKKAQTIHEFLDNPNHMVVSSRGRPWVITEKEPARAFGPNIWNLIPMSQEGTKPKRTHSRELEVVSSGTKSYERAEKLRNLFLEYLYHETQVFKKLILEENEILRSSQPAS